MPFTVAMFFFFDKFRKYLIRNFKQFDPNKPNWFTRNVIY